MQENSSQKPRPYAAFDIDGTIVRWQLFHALIDELAKQHIIDEQAYQGAHAARMEWKQRTHEEAFSNYEKTLMATYFGSITSVTPAQLQNAAEAAFSKQKDRVYRYTRELIHELKAQGYMLFAISRSNEELVSLLAQYYEFDDYIGTHLVVEEGCYTGEEQDNSSVSKQILVERLVTKHGASKENSIAVGDSEGDIDMLSVVEHPIAFNPSKKLFQHAQAHDWKVVIERKNMIYELEPHTGVYILADNT